MDETEPLQTIADAADAAAVALGWMPQRTIVLQDLITDTGEREVVIAISRDLRKQDALGLLHYAAAVELAGITRDALDE